MRPGDLPQSKNATWIAQVMVRRTCWAGPGRLKSKPCTSHVCRRGLFAVRRRINRQQYVSPAQHSTAEVGHSTICLCDFDTLSLFAPLSFVSIHFLYFREGAIESYQRKPCFWQNDETKAQVPAESRQPPTR